MQSAPTEQVDFRKRLWLSNCQHNRSDRPSYVRIYNERLSIRRTSQRHNSHQRLKKKPISQAIKAVSRLLSGIILNGLVHIKCPTIAQLRKQHINCTPLCSKAETKDLNSFYCFIIYFATMYRLVSASVVRFLSAI